MPKRPLRPVPEPLSPQVVTVLRYPSSTVQPSSSFVPGS